MASQVHFLYDQLVQEAHHSVESSKGKYQDLEFKLRRNAYQTTVRMVIIGRQPHRKIPLQEDNLTGKGPHR